MNEITVRGEAMTYTGRLIVETCCNCSMQFAMPEDLRARRIEDQRNFFCPNGHSQHYTGPTEAQKAERRVEAARAETARAERMLAARTADLAFERRSHAATKGKLTKTRKRADAGVCLHCKRSFANVSRHVAHMHPAEA